MPKGYARSDPAPRPEGPRLLPAPPPPEVAAADSQRTTITFDDPEDAEWFQRLPPPAQAEMRRVWAEEQARGVQRRGFAHSTLKRSMVQGAGVFLFTETCCASPSWLHSLAALVVGAGVGSLWHRLHAGRFRCMVTSVVPFAALRIAFPVDSFLTTTVFAVLGFLMLLGLTAGVGFVRERRRADDLDF